MALRPLLALFLALASLSEGQTRRTSKTPAPRPTAEAPTSWPIARITIEGNHNFSAEQILAVAGLSVGKMVNKAELDAAHERLVACGAFDSAAYRYEPAANHQGIALTFELVEVPAYYPMLFEDLPATDDQIRAWLKSHDPLFGSKISATKEALAHYQKLISEFLVETRNDHQPITAKLSAESPPDLVILFRPATPRKAISQVRASNTGEIPSGVVQSTAYGVAVGTVFSEPRFRQVLDNSIRPLYEAKGHMRVAFSRIESEPDPEVKGVIVKFAVDQGPVFKFGKIQVSGADTSNLELSRMLKIKTGELSDFDAVKAAQSRLETRFRHDGFMQARTEVLRTVHDEAQTIDVNIRVNPGPLFTFHELTILGLDIESEPVIRKLWGLQPGKPFNPDYPNHFLDRVNEMGLFDDLKSTEAERKVNPDNHTVDVTLTFKGGRPAPVKPKIP